MISYSEYGCELLSIDNNVCRIKVFNSKLFNEFVLDCVRQFQNSNMIDYYNDYAKVGGEYTLSLNFLNRYNKTVERPKKLKILMGLI